MIMNLFKLPASVKVKISKGSSGKWIVELPEYDIFAQVDSKSNIDGMVTSLVFTHFDLPDKYINSVRYVPKDTPMKIDASKIGAFPFLKFTSFPLAIPLP